MRRWWGKKEQEGEVMRQLEREGTVFERNFRDFEVFIGQNPDFFR